MWELAQALCRQSAFGFPNQMLQHKSSLWNVGPNNGLMGLELHQVLCAFFQKGHIDVFGRR
jgi:hypothetical protein